MPAGLHDQSKNSPGTAAAAAQVSQAQSLQDGQDLKLEATFRQAPAAASRLSKLISIAAQIYLFLPVAILALEGFFAIAGIGQGEIVKPDLQLGCRHIANKLVTWRLEGYSRSRLNSAGMRDDEHTLTKPPGVTRLAFLGDSFTEGLQVPLQDTFVRRLQNSLNTASKPKYETLNFGCSSYSTGQELLQFEQQVAAYKPDLVVLLYSPGDTLENSVSPFKRSTAEARPYFYLDQNQVLRQDDGVLALNFEKLKPRPLREFLRANSTIYGAYSQTNLSLLMSDKVYFRTTRLFTQIASKLAARLASSIANSANSRASLPGLVPPGWQEPDKLLVSEAVVERLNRDVKAQGGKLVLMAFPDIGKGDPLYVTARARLAKLARARDFGYLDLSDSFSHANNPSQLFIKVHFSQAGHDLAAGELASYLKKSALLPR